MKMQWAFLAAALASAPAAAHEWYSGLVSPKAGVGSCCNQTDCQPVEACLLPGGVVGIAMRGQCFMIERDAVLELPSPDGQTHACMAAADTKPRCIILGAGV